MLEHRNLERLGAHAAAAAKLLGNGWPGMLAAFAELAEAEAGAPAGAEH